MTQDLPFNCSVLSFLACKLGLGLGFSSKLSLYKRTPRAYNLKDVL